METVRIRDPGWKKVGSGIRDKHPGSATLFKTDDKVPHGKKSLKKGVGSGSINQRYGYGIRIRTNMSRIPNTDYQQITWVTFCIKKMKNLALATVC